MARKSLGHIELEWECPKCGIRNPGSRSTCNGCGAPQPDHVEFHTPASAQIIEDEERLARATAGPDMHCPYCNARNLADATLCPQCGGDLTDAAVRNRGQVLGALHTDPDATFQCRVCGMENPATEFTCTGCGAPLQDTRKTEQPSNTVDADAESQAASKPKRGCSFIGMGAIALIALLLISGVIYFFGGTVESLTGTAVEAQWNRTIEVEGLTPVTREGWRAEIPAGATVMACRQEVQRTVQEPVPDAREVCGTPYVIDEGTGFGEAVQDCEYQILADFCSYEILEWRKVDDIRVEGIGHELRWPEFVATDNQREGNRSQTLQCIFDAGDRTFTYRMSNEDQFTQCVPGTEWELEINRAGGITSAQRR